MATVGTAPYAAIPSIELDLKRMFRGLRHGSGADENGWEEGAGGGFHVPS